MYTHTEHLYVHYTCAHMHHTTEVTRTESQLVGKVKPHPLTKWHHTQQSVESFWKTTPPQCLRPSPSTPSHTRAIVAWMPPHYVHPPQLIINHALCLTFVHIATMTIYEAYIKISVDTPSLPKSLRAFLRARLVGHSSCVWRKRVGTKEKVGGVDTFSLEHLTWHNLPWPQQINCMIVID